jgi:hypothetical protein
MRRKIIEQQRQLEANDLNLDLENNKSSAMYNKDLYNGVVQMVEDTRSRYEIEMDNLEQENMAMTNLKKLFGKDNSEIRKSMNVLNFSTDYVKVFNKYFSTIYRDLNGVYNLLASDFQQYFDRFFDKITKTAGVEMPAQESTLAGVQENIDKLQQQTINASDNIKDLVLDSLDVSSLNVAKRLKDYITMIIELNDVYTTTSDPDLRNDMDALGLTDSFINSELPLLGDPTITVQQKEDILLKYVQKKADNVYSIGGIAATDKGALGRSVRVLRSAYADNGIPIDEKQIYNKAVQSLRSPDAAKNILEDINMHASIIMPAFKDFYAKGKSAREVLTPYISLRAQILGIPEDQIKIQDMYEVGSGAVPLTIQEYKAQVYKSNEYKQSDNYKSVTLGDTTAMLRAFNLGA